MKNYFWDVFPLCFPDPFWSRQARSPVLQAPPWHSILCSLAWGICCLCCFYRGIHARRTWSESLSSSPAAHAGLRRPWADTDLVSLPCFVALMFSMLAAFPDNFLSMENLENSPLQELYVPLAHAVASGGVFYQTGVYGARGWSPSALFPLCPRSTGPLLSPCPCRCQCHAQGCSHRPSIPVIPNWPLASQQSWRGHRNHLLLILLSAIPVPPHS